MTLDDIAAMIRRHEGYRDRVYIDTAGNPTGGWGHAFLKGSKLPADVCLILFEHDFDRAIRYATAAQKRYCIDLDPVREGVLINMAFQLGLKGLLRFIKMFQALRLNAFDAAADQILDSKAARQCPNRYRELAELMRTGKA